MGGQLIRPEGQWGRNEDPHVSFGEDTHYVRTSHPSTTGIKDDLHSRKKREIP